MKTYAVEITGKTPLLMHYDNIEWADHMDARKNSPANKKGSKRLVVFILFVFLVMKSLQGNTDNKKQIDHTEQV